MVVGIGNKLKKVFGIIGRGVSKAFNWGKGVAKNVGEFYLENKDTIDSIGGMFFGNDKMETYSKNLDIASKILQNPKDLKAYTGLIETAAPAINKYANKLRNSYNNYQDKKQSKSKSLPVWQEKQQQEQEKQQLNKTYSPFVQLSEDYRKSYSGKK
jgi:hypothetical protein